MALHRLTDELQPGSMLNQDVYSRDKVLLLSKGSILTKENIRTIKRLGYKEINVLKVNTRQNITRVKRALWNHIDKTKLMQFQKSYNQSAEEIIELIKYISDGHNVDVEKAYQIPKLILQDVGTPSNLFAYLNQIELLDNHTYGHCINVSLICSAICQWLNLQKDIAKGIIVSGLLHDIGKRYIDEKILNKPSLLTLDEWEKIKIHTIWGYRILKNANAPNMACMGALFHHEREDGNGYPLGLTGSRIPLTSKIIAVADVYDAMTSHRPYRSKICPFKVIEELKHEFFNSLDLKILIPFLIRVAECYVGETVRLSDGRVGQIAVINASHPAQPLIHTDDGVINLINEAGVEIEAILSLTDEPNKYQNIDYNSFY